MQLQKDDEDNYQRLLQKALSSQVISETRVSCQNALLPSKALRKLAGKDIHKKASNRKGRYLVLFCAKIAHAAGGKLGTLNRLDSRCPEMVVDLPHGRARFTGCLVFPDSRYITLRPQGGGVVCEDVFENVIVFSEVAWLGRKENNPDDKPLPMPTGSGPKLHKGAHVFSSGVGDRPSSDEQGNVVKSSKEEKPVISMEGSEQDGDQSNEGEASDPQNKPTANQVAPRRATSRAAAKGKRYIESDDDGAGVPQAHEEIPDHEVKAEPISDQAGQSEPANGKDGTGKFSAWGADHVHRSTTDVASKQPCESGPSKKHKQVKAQPLNAFDVMKRSSAALHTSLQKQKHVPTASGCAGLTGEASMNPIDETGTIAADNAAPAKRRKSASKSTAATLKGRNPVQGTQLESRMVGSKDDDMDEKLDVGGKVAGKDSIGEKACSREQFVLQEGSDRKDKVKVRGGEQASKSKKTDGNDGKRKNASGRCSTDENLEKASGGLSNDKQDLEQGVNLSGEKKRRRVPQRSNREVSYTEAIAEGSSAEDDQDDDSADEDFLS